MTVGTVTRSIRQRVPAAIGGVPRWAIGGLLGAIGAFLAVTAWWFAADSSILDWDSGRHIKYTWAMRTAIGNGDLLAPITLDNLNHYPPLMYLVGGIGMTIAGWQSIDSAMVAADLVFVPLLALGCWGAARLAYGELAGVLAAVFALGAPMVVSMFHMYMLDAPQAAAVAVTVWLVLVSRRFERVGVSALAGLAGTGAMLLKPTSAVFLAGFVAAVLARGGWRRPRGLAAFCAPAVVLALPWYIAQLQGVRGLTSGVVGASSGPGGAAVTYITPARWSEENVFWYAWNLLNLQLMAPLFVAFVAGTAAAVVRFWRTRDPADPTPELVVGGLVSYLGMTWVTLKDPRYTLPALVYVAVLGVAWAGFRWRGRAIASAALVVVAAVNLLGVSTGTGRLLAVDAPGASPKMLGERSVRFYMPTGYIQSKPRDDSDALAVMRALRREGIDTIELDPGGTAAFNPTGLQVLMSVAELRQPPVYTPTALPHDVPFLTRHPITPEGPRPCGVLSDGQGLYVVRMPNVAVPFEDYRIQCPPRG
jgi:Dolichyl-phosphate-mannose-protein mannosyltransferase